MGWDNALSPTLLRRGDEGGGLTPRIMSSKTNSGFTIIEVLIVIAVITILSAAALPVSYNFLNKNDLNLTAQKIVQTMRRAQFLSQANDSDSAWGVHVQAGEVTVFKGESYAARDSGRDEIYTFPVNETISGSTDFVFSKLNGYPTLAGTITITSPNATKKDVVVNACGTVEY